MIQPKPSSAIGKPAAAAIKRNELHFFPGERLSGEMIHTTPVDEARTVRSLAVSLVSSHGGIHVRPVDRDRFHAAGAFAPGTDLIIHRYDERLPKDFR